jgi:hypothetical protein
LILLSDTAAANRQPVLIQLKWTPLTLPVAFIIMLLLPLPVDLALALVAFLGLGWYRRYLLLRKLGMKNSPSAGTGFEFKKIKE